MEAFKFKLQKILEYREKIAGESEKKLALKLKQCNTLERKIEFIGEERQRSRMVHGKNRDLETMQRLALYDERLREQSYAVRGQLTKLEEEKLVLQQDYLDKLKKQKVLANLKEVKYGQYKLERKRYEEKVLDDIIMARYESEEN
ncbi:MAG: hypothetical protein FWE37_08100 [Spirochaetaceae bacterium]|nr:hypothetical protein [Spirochaetaceae bacterium]